MSTAASHKTGGRGEALVTGEFILHRNEFDQIARTIHGLAGIYLTEAKATLVYSRLAKRLRALKMSSYRQYCDFIASEPGSEELTRMCAVLTTNVTRFFREAHHFDHLRDRVLPDLIERAVRGQSVRIWSSACSSGEEPYSIALTALEVDPKVAALDFRILATDINGEKLNKGRQGIYSEPELEHVSKDMRQRWFSAESNETGREYLVAPEARKLVAFRELNLMGAWPMKRKLDVIFCRNVAIYFNAETQAKLWSRLTGSLAPSGYLYIGHSERISGPRKDELQHVGPQAFQLNRLA